jgi:cysteinyl-tRNA synthetase
MGAVTSFPEFYKGVLVKNQTAKNLCFISSFILLITAGCDEIEKNCSGKPLALSEIRFWGYQIQDINADGVVDSLAESHYDMLVLEPTRTDWSSKARDFNTKEMVPRLKNTCASDGDHRKLIIAYIDIGEAEDWRWYWSWSEEWKEDDPKPEDWPDYIITHDPDGWGGNYPVAYWDKTWKDIVIYGENQSSSPYGDYNSIIDEVIKDGFDGIYLDWVEAFENEEVIQAAVDAGLDPAEEMIRFIGEMREYAEERNPEFIIIQQNAASLAEGHSELFSVIDAIAQEAIWYDGDATDNWNDPHGHDAVNDDDLVEYYLYYLDLYQKADIPVFACEYALIFADDAYEKAYEMDYVPYVTRRSLGRLTTTPP